MRIHNPRFLICAALCALFLNLGISRAQTTSSVQSADSATTQPIVPTNPLTLTRQWNRDSAAKSPDDPLYACACGCAIFEVGTSSMIPLRQGGTFFLEYDYQDQNRNWSGTSRAPAADNPDKETRTNFLTAGIQYMFNRNWGVQVEVPYDFRHFQTTGGASGNDIVTVNWGSVGDIRIQGIYTGFSEDLSSGITFGLKLPTGSFTHNDAFGDVDRDSELGTGSTDLLLGGFHRDSLTADNAWNWFAQVNADLPVLIQEQYRPGYEIDGAVGVYYDRISLGRVKVAPVAQVLAAERTSDGGANSAHPVGSGYQRLFLSPGIELHMHPYMIYADVEFPVYQHMTGDQLIAPALVKVILSYSF